jgi:hypothetical protein
LSADSLDLEESGNASRAIGAGARLGNFVETQQARMIPTPDMTPRIDTNKIVTIATAAKQLKISRQAAWEAVASGRLKTIDIDGVQFVTLKSVQEYLKSRRPRGPKPTRKQ